MSFDLQVKNIRFDGIFPVNIDWSPCGKYIAMGMDNGVVHMVTPAGETVWRLVEPHDDKVRRVVFSPDGSKLVSTSVDKYFCIWNTEDGEEIEEHELNEPVLFPVWSPDGTRLLMDGPDCRPLVRNAETFEIEYEGVEHYEHNTAVAWGPKDVIASGSFDNFVHLIDLKEKEYLYSLTCFKEEIVSLCPLKRDGFFLVTGVADGQLTLHDIDSGMELMNTQAHKGRINDIKSSNDGRAFATAGADNTVRIYSSDLLTEFLSFPYFQNEVCSVAFSPDGNFLATASIFEGLTIWDIGAWYPDGF